MINWKSRVIVFLISLSTGPIAIASGTPLEVLERGEYLAKAAGCANCHSEDYAGGQKLEAGDKGTFFAPNITPDKENGIGDWSDDDFVMAMKKGYSKTKGHLYPIFPYTSYAKMTKNDVLAIKRFIFEKVKPSSKRSKEHVIPFPYNKRLALKVWKAAGNFIPRGNGTAWYSSRNTFRTIQHRSKEWNRGAYLVNGVLHCTQCHSPRKSRPVAQEGDFLVYQWQHRHGNSTDFNGNRNPLLWLKGGVMPDGTKAPDITKTPDGEKWPVLADYDGDEESFKSDMELNFLAVSDEKMTLVVEESMAHLTAKDLSAMSTYLNNPDYRKDPRKKDILKRLNSKKQD